MNKEETKEQNRQWAIRLIERRDSEKYKLDKMSPDNPAYEWQRGRWSSLVDTINGEFTKKLLEEL